MERNFHMSDMFEGNLIGKYNQDIKGILSEMLQERKWWKISFPLLKVENKNCWTWLNKNKNGYSFVWINGKQVYAHRIFYEKTVGQIPDGLTIDHLCKNPCCVNPEHMEIVTQRENILRSGNLASINSRKTHCKRGHEFTRENTKIYNGRRLCKSCRKMWVKK